MAVVGVIPAAGHATRLQPLDCSKEVYPVAGRPVMDYLVERMRLAPCSEIRVVTRPDKVDVIDNARRHGATIVEGRPASLAESILLGVRGLPDEGVVAIGFPDSIWEPVDGFASVLALLANGWDVALGLFRGSETWRYEPVVLEAERVTRIEFKPPRSSSDWLWGCAAATARTLLGLEGRDEPGPYFDELAQGGAVGGVRLSGSYIDIGTPSGLREAQASARSYHS